MVFVEAATRRRTELLVGNSIVRTSAVLVGPQYFGGRGAGGLLLRPNRCINALQADRPRPHEAQTVDLQRTLRTSPFVLFFPGDW